MHAQREKCSPSPPHKQRQILHTGNPHNRSQEPTPFPDYLPRVHALCRWTDKAFPCPATLLICSPRQSDAHHCTPCIQLLAKTKGTQNQREAAIQNSPADTYMCFSKASPGQIQYFSLACLVQEGNALPPPPLAMRNCSDSCRQVHSSPEQMGAPIAMGRSNVSNWRKANHHRALLLGC